MEYAARAGTTTARYWGSDSAAACGYANVHDSTSKSVNRFNWENHACNDGVAQTAAVGNVRWRSSSATRPIRAGSPR